MGLRWTEPVERDDDWWDNASKWQQAKQDPEKGELSIWSLGAWDREPRWELAFWVTPGTFGFGIEYDVDHNAGWQYGKVEGPIWEHRHMVTVRLAFWSWTLMREKREPRFFP